MNLLCPRCNHITQWDRETKPEGPGTCLCGTFQHWKVISDEEVERRKNTKGFVRLLTDKGWQELKPPYYREK